jgi:NAD(P)-dependent dehydrogenase (short-subunit alcohol dehydrogenase family)
MLLEPFESKGGCEMRRLLALMLALFIGHDAMAADAKPASDSPQQAVLVTGASAGIGRKVTERLAAEGYYVFAGARKEQDLKDLSAIRNVQGIRFDVTVPAEVAAAVEVVRNSGRPLHGIVNNAGVVVVDPVLSTSEADFDFQMQVNVYGVFRVTKAFAPLVIASKGRIVNISSISAFLSDPGTSAYTMSKAAVEALSNVMASEMAPLGVSVIVVEPGSYNTNILKPALERSVTKGFEADRSGMKPPDEVATAVFQALSDAKPKRRYMIVPEQAQAAETIRGVVDVLMQLNADQAYTYDRAALNRMMDDAAAKARAR